MRACCSALIAVQHRASEFSSAMMLPHSTHPLNNTPHCLTIGSCMLCVVATCFCFPVNMLSTERCPGACVKYSSIPRGSIINTPPVALTIACTANSVALTTSCVVFVPTCRYPLQFVHPYSLCQKRQPVINNSSHQLASQPPDHPHPAKQSRLLLQQHGQPQHSLNSRTRRTGGNKLG